MELLCLFLQMPLWIAISFSLISHPHKVPFLQYSLKIIISKRKGIALSNHKRENILVETLCLINVESS